MATTEVYGTDLDVAIPLSDLAKSPQAGLAIVSGSENVRQALLLRLNTPIGDLIMHPDVGNRALDMLADPITEPWIAGFKAAILDCADEEPRAIILGLDVTVQRELGKVRVVVWYREASSPGPTNLVLSANLGQVGASFAVSV